MSTSNLCQQSQVHRLYSLYLHFDASHSAKHEDPECRAVLDQCFQLLEKDYIVGRVDNRNGQLCSTYPAELAILEGVRNDASSTIGLLGSLDLASPRDHLEHVQSDNVRPVPAATASAADQRQPPPPPPPRQHMDGPKALAPQAHVSQAPQRPPPVPLPMDPLDVDQTLDLDDSGMMSFQDIRAELDHVHQNSLDQALWTSQPNAIIGRRNILPFPFRLPPIKSDQGPKSRTASPANVPLPQSPPPPPLSRSVQDPSSLTTTHKVNDTQELLRLFEKSHFARVRARFVVPCILVRGKNVCRSGTLSNEVEVFMHNVNQKFNDLNQKRKTFLYGTGEKSPEKEDRESSLTKQRSEDIALLHRLGVTYINDLMVENRKVKYGLKVTSSEKVDSFGRYSSFKLVATPYPGVEFFQKFKANKYSARKLCFDWSQTFADADFQLPNGHTDNLGILWRDYKQWDLIELTQNYLRLYLNFIADGTYDPFSSPTNNTSPYSGANISSSNENIRSPKGLLIHCISGWDRTPLFISLLRISLWADGEIHSSLSAAELLYLTIGYDWFLFNHLLADRSSKGEDIFYFCFYFLKFIYSDDFSLEHIARIATEKSKFDDKKSSLSETFTDDVCESCRCLSPSDRLRLFGGHGSCGNMGYSAPKNDVSSSVDGKPSSWQFVSFAAGPTAMSSSTGRDSQPRYGSPRGSSGGHSTGIHFSPSAASSLSSRQQGSGLPLATATPSPGQSGSRAVFQSTSASNNKYSSSSGRPNPSPGQYATTPSKLGGCEMLRTATSPDLGSDAAAVSEGSCSDAKGCLERNTRKRASTFDGGLLIGSVTCGVHPSDGHESDDEEEGEDDMEDLTSGDDAEHEPGHDNLFTPSHPANVPQRSSIPGRPLSPHQRQYQDCRYCHQRFAVTRSRSDLDTNCAKDGTTKFNNASTLGSKESRRGSDQGNRVGGGSCSYSSVLSEGREKRSLRSQNRNLADSDREEVFQLEIEDSRATTHRPVDLAQQRRLSSILSPAMDHRRKSFLDLLRADRHTDENEQDHDNQDHEEDHDRKGVAGATRERFSLSEGEWDPSSRSGALYTTRRTSTTSFSKGCGGNRSDGEDDDDDDGEEGLAGSLGSFQSGLKLEQHQNDRMFMPSLQGMFASSEDSFGYTGPSSKHGRVPLTTHETGSGRIQSDSQQQQHHRHSPQQTPQQQRRRRPSSSSTAESPSFEGGETPKRNGPSNKSTRRQRLREIRRLFMEMRHEIGDGARPPSRGGRHLLVAAAATASSAVVGATGVGAGHASSSGVPLDDSSDHMSPSGLTDDGLASSFPFVFDLHHHRQQRHPHTNEPPPHQHHAQKSRRQEIPNEQHRNDHPSSPSSSSHHYVASFFGKSSSPILREPDGGTARADKDTELHGASTTSGRRSPLEWATAATASISSGKVLHSTQHPHQEMQPAQTPAAGNYLGHRPSIPEVPAHLMAGDTSVGSSTLSSQTAGHHHHDHRHYNHPRHQQQQQQQQHHHNSHISHHHPFQQHQDEEGEVHEGDIEPFHDEDSIDYSASYSESCDISSSVSFLRSEGIFTSTLAAASAQVSPPERRQRPLGPVVSQPSNFHQQQHHQQQHHQTERREATDWVDSVPGSTTPPSPRSPLSWLEGSSPSRDYYSHSHGSNRCGQAYPHSPLAPQGTLPTLAAESPGTLNTSTATPSRSTPINAPMPRFRGAKERTGENGRLWDWMPGIFA